VKRRSARETLLGVGVLVLLLAGAAVTTLWLRLSGSVPDLSGTVTVAGLADSVLIRVDSFGNPHIDAKSDHDALWAEGWMHASERLWQMELLQRTARGRLSELFGPAGLPTDRFMRTLGVWDAAGRALEELDPATRRDLDAYVAGVNARIRSWKRSLPPEFALLRVGAAPWTARASMAVGKLMALDLSTWQEELDRWHARRILPASRTAILQPRWPDWAPTTLAGPSGVRDSFQGSADSAGGAGRAGVDLEALDPLGAARAVALTASNAWIVGGTRSASGLPLLANDTHLGLRAPSTWYLLGLRAEEGDLDVAGLSIPGVPGIVIGLNHGVAWGFTNGYADDMDFAVEAVNPDGTAYRTAEGWRDFAVRAETLRVRGHQEPELLRVRSTLRGPLLSDVLPGTGESLSAVWVAAHTTGGLAGILAMDRATDASSFDRAVRLYDGPAQNVLWAAADGRVGYRLGGAVPRRTGWAEGLPVSSSAMGEGPVDLVSPDSLPAALFDPAGGSAPLPRGYLVSANNLQEPGALGRFGAYFDPFRARLITDRVADAEDWGPRDMEDLQRDTHSLLADLLLGQAVGAARALGADSAASLLSRWDRRADSDERAPGLFYAWLYRTRSLIAGDEYLDRGRSYFPMQAFLDVVLDHPTSPWVDDIRTDTIESLAGLERRAMRDAISVTSLRPWRQLNRERSRHPLGSVGWLDRLFHFNVGPVPAPGGPHTIRVSSSRDRHGLDSASWLPPYTGDFGPSERFVASIESDGPRGWFLLPTGEGGNPLDRHYRDMAARWNSTGGLVPLPLATDAIRALTVSRLRLVPERSRPPERGETPPR
jgi:penicillin amidase